MEKEQYTVSSSPDYNDHGYVDPATGQETKSGRLEVS